MGRETVLFKSEERKKRTEAADMLRRVADKLEEGSLTLKQSGNEVVLDFPDNMVLEVKVEEEINQDTKRSLELELEWIVGGVDDTTMEIS